MIAIKDFKMPRGCYECPFADESIRMDCDYYCQAAKDKPDVQYGLNKPDWCPLVDVPDINVGKCSEIPNNSDCVSRRAVFDALNEYFARIGKLKRRGLTKGEKAISLDTVGVIETLPSVHPEQRYTEEELRVFKHGISLSLLSKRSSQHWKYDEDTATEIKFLERLYEKVGADMRGEQE